MLANHAIHGISLIKWLFPQGAATAFAGLAAAAVNEQLLGEVPGLAVSADEIQDHDGRAVKNRA